MALGAPCTSSSVRVNSAGGRCLPNHPQPPPYRYIYPMSDANATLHQRLGCHPTPTPALVSTATGGTTILLVLCPQLRLEPWTPLLLRTSHLMINSVVRCIGPASNTGSKRRHGSPLPPSWAATCLSSLLMPAGPVPLQSAPASGQAVPTKHKLSTSFLI